MRLLPYHTFEMRSPLKPAAALEALKAHIEPFKMIMFRWPNQANDKRFTGEADANGFRLHRVLGYRNSFAPLAEGTLHAEGSGTRIAVRMRLASFALVFVLFFAVVILGFVLIPGGELGWFAFVLLPFVYGMTMIGFWIEAPRQERSLREIFQAPP